MTVPLLLAASLLLLAPGASLASAVWTKVYGGNLHRDDFAYASAADGKGDVIVTGQSQTSNHGLGISTIMYSSAGSQVWEHAETVPGDRASGARITGSLVAVDSGGNATAFGQIDNGATAVVATYAPDGTRTNRVEVAFPDVNAAYQINSLQVYPNGDFSVVGSDLQLDPGTYIDQYWFVERFDSAGHVIFAENESGVPPGSMPLVNYAVGGYVANNGDLIVAGSETYDDSGALSLDVRSYDANGDKGGNISESGDSFAAVALTHDAYGNAYVVAQDIPGRNPGIEPPDGGATTGPGLVVKAVRDDLYFRYQLYYNAPGKNITPTAIAVDKDRNILVGGYNYGDGPNGGGYDCQFVKFNESDGRRLWAHTSQKSADYEPSVVGLFAQTDTNAFYAVENLFNDNVNDNGGQAAKIVVTKFKSDGNMISEQYYDGSAARPDEAYATGGAYDASTDSLFAIGYQLDQPNPNRDQDFNWVTQKYQFR